MDKHLIEINNLNFKYKNNIILNNISFNITENENIGILGRNGGGKSTLIKILLGFLKPASGLIKYNIDRKKIGYLPQIREFDAVFPISVYDLVISGLTNRKNLFRRFDLQEKKAASDIMDEFGIAELNDKLINEVSGGQLQRALIARALISNPELIILDEPESFLDKNFEAKLYNKLKTLKNSTVIIISHDPEEIYQHIDSVLLVEKEAKFYKDKNTFMKGR
ncbi:MAG: metal ABC transporter ATP-binding protein [Fusobacteriales bacterium]|jgi:zinc transport system ATP-binding protein|nr:metal ABC transporter ATP-binding protein [Fusobacteriales bacterium]